MTFLQNKPVNQSEVDEHATIFYAANGFCQSFSKVEPYWAPYLIGFSEML